MGWMNIGARLVVLGAAGLLSASCNGNGGGLGKTAGSLSCGLTNLDATYVDPDGDGQLECSPGGESIAVRTDFLSAGPNPNRTPTFLTAFFTLADFQLADEESPLRGEWADKCGDLPTAGAFRPQETMVPHLLNAHVRATNAIAEAGSPILGGELDFAVALGDLADNQQFNEVRTFIDILDGEKLVDTDSGADGYDGVQASEPNGAGGLNALVPGGSILHVANEPFWATGLRAHDAPIPWYSVVGNHDMKVQGTVTDLPGWREFARAWAVGGLKVTDLGPDHQQEICDDPSKFGDPDFWARVVASPETTKPVPSDADRRLLDREDWIREHDDTTGVPAGHGFGGERCTDEGGAPLARGCYAFTRGEFRFIALDTAAQEGLETGNLDGPQFAWLERELIEASRSYLSPEGFPVDNPMGIDKLIVVFTHHTISSTTNSGLPLIPCPACTVHDGTALRDLLIRFPNVILQMSGHTHENRIFAHTNGSPGRGYWEVNTSAIVDYPQQSRTIEIADNGDCTLSIFAVIYDGLVLPNARMIDWDGDDPTDEVVLGGAERRINEDWLAAAAVENAFLDPQGSLDSLGDPEDRNVELLLPAPDWLCAGI